MFVCVCDLRLFFLSQEENSLWNWHHSISTPFSQFRIGTRNVSIQLWTENIIIDLENQRPINRFVPIEFESSLSYLPLSSVTNLWRFPMKWGSMHLNEILVLPKTQNGFIPKHNRIVHFNLFNNRRKCKFAFSVCVCVCVGHESCSIYGIIVA